MIIPSTTLVGELRSPFLESCADVEPIAIPQLVRDSVISEQ
jgi:hypothetical protein